MLLSCSVQIGVLSGQQPRGSGPSHVCMLGVPAASVGTHTAAHDGDARPSLAALLPAPLELEAASSASYAGLKVSRRLGARGAVAAAVPARAFKFVSWV